MRVENQQYIHYRKGSLVFYRLREEIGEETSQPRAAQRSSRDKAFQQPPYTTTLELLDYIRAETPPDKQELITDLFEKIMLLRRPRSTAATAKKRGRRQVRRHAQAARSQALCRRQGQGNRRHARRLDGRRRVRARTVGQGGATRTVLYLQRAAHHAARTRRSLSWSTHEPYEAGLDPYNKLIDRVSGRQPQAAGVNHERCGITPNRPL